MYGGPLSWTGGCSCKELAAASGQHGMLPEHQQQGRSGPSATPASPREQTSRVPARPPPWLQSQRAPGHGVLPAPHSQASGLCGLSCVGTCVPHTQPLSPDRATSSQECPFYCVTGFLKGVAIHSTQTAVYVPTIYQARFWERQGLASWLSHACTRTKSYRESL